MIMLARWWRSGSGLVTAMQMAKAEPSAPVENHLCPSITHSLPSLRAVVPMNTGFEPANSGSVMVKQLRGGTHIEKIREANDRLQYAEGEADKVMLTLLKDLYHGPYDAKELVILQEIYELVEQAVDRCRNAGNVVVQIVLKHS